MTNPSSRLTKFRLILEEYDFVVRYIKGKDNVVADALSRIDIASDELKNINNTVCNAIYVTTRLKTSEIDKQNNARTSSDEGVEHPGVIELLKRPKDSFQLCPVSSIEFETIIKNKKYDLKLGNFLCNKCSRIIYIKEDSRSALNLGSMLRDLKNIYDALKIPELVILKMQSAHK